jgi:sugar/nucleoside kinase (ribokinase family)
MMPITMRTLLHGEALVDLHSDQPGLAGPFTPRVGGVAATIAQAAAREGADVAFAGAVGDDAWGAWLRERLAADGVDVAQLATEGEHPTPLTFTVSGTTTLHGAAVAQTREPDPDDAGALVLTADTLATEDEHTATLAARDHAVKAGKPVVAALTFSRHRWETPAFAASAARELVKDTFLVCAAAEEARLITGEDDPAAAADGLNAMGATHAIVVHDTGAVLRGAALRLSTQGAARPETVLGTVIADLAGTDFYPAAIAAALPRATGGR